MGSDGMGMGVVRKRRWSGADDGRDGRDGGQAAYQPSMVCRGSDRAGGQAGHP